MRRAAIGGPPAGSKTDPLLDWLIAAVLELQTASFEETADQMASDVAANYQPLDGMLTALSALVAAADKGLYFTGADAPAQFDLTAAGRALVDDLTTAAQRTTLGLGTGDSPTFTALTLSNGQLVFPAVQVASANANTLDDYEEGTWTPDFSFTTPGNLAKTYSTQVGWYLKVGGLVAVSFDLITSAFTHTTASGAIFIDGLPFTASASISWGPIALGGWTMAGYTAAALFVASGGTSAGIATMGSGAGIAQPTTAHFPSGGTVNLRGAVVYRAS
jgi:hypothetical protein